MTLQKHPRFSSVDMPSQAGIAKMGSMIVARRSVLRAFPLRQRGLLRMTSDGGGVSRQKNLGRGSTHLAEIFERCADYLATSGDTELVDFLRRAATDADAKQPLSLDNLDVMFAPGGALENSSIVGGWREEYIGLAAAYRSESAELRD